MFVQYNPERTTGGAAPLCFRDGTPHPYAEVAPMHFSMTVASDFRKTKA